MRKWIGREDRVVKDHGFGLAPPEETDFQFLPESVGTGVRLAVTEPAEPAASLVVMPETMMSHGQERPVARFIELVSEFRQFFKPSNHVLKPTGAGPGRRGASSRRSGCLTRISPRRTRPAATEL